MQSNPQSKELSMLKKIVSRHVISNGGRFRILQGSSIALLLECGHAALGTQSESGNREHTSCRMCESNQAQAVKGRIQELELEIQKLKRSITSTEQPTSRVYPPLRKDRTELKKQLLGLLGGGTQATARQLAALTGENSDSVGKTLGNMAEAGLVQRTGRAADGLVLWAALTASPTGPQRELPVT